MCVFVCCVFCVCCVCCVLRVCVLSVLWIPFFFFFFFFFFSFFLILPIFRAGVLENFVVLDDMDLSKKCNSPLIKGHVVVTTVTEGIHHLKLRVCVCLSVLPFPFLFLSFSFPFFFPPLFFFSFSFLSSFYSMPNAPFSLIYYFLYFQTTRSKA